MSKHHEVKVTSAGWCVSVMTGSGIDGARLSVFRHYTLPVKPGDRDRWGRFLRGPERYVTRYGDGNDRMFANSDAAFAWAHEHGYLEVYRRRTWCRDHRALHTFMGKPSPTFGTCFGDC